MYKTTITCSKGRVHFPIRKSLPVLAKLNTSKYNFGDLEDVLYPINNVMYFDEDSNPGLSFRDGHESITYADFPDLLSRGYTFFILQSHFVIRVED